MDEWLNFVQTYMVPRGWPPDLHHKVEYAYVIISIISFHWASNKTVHETNSLIWKVTWYKWSTGWLVAEFYFSRVHLYVSRAADVLLIRCLLHMQGLTQEGVAVRVGVGERRGPAHTRAALFFPRWASQTVIWSQKWPCLGTEWGWTGVLWAGSQ